MKAIIEQRKLCDLIQVTQILQRMPQYETITKRITKDISKGFKTITPNKNGKKIINGWDKVTYHSNGLCVTRHGHILLPPFEFKFPELKEHKVTTRMLYSKHFRSYGPLYKLLAKRKVGMHFRKQYYEEDKISEMYEQYLKIKPYEKNMVVARTIDTIKTKLQQQYRDIEDAFISNFCDAILGKYNYNRNCSGDKKYYLKFTLPTESYIQAVVNSVATDMDLCGVATDMDLYDMDLYDEIIEFDDFADFKKVFKQRMKDLKYEDLNIVLEKMGVKME